MIPCGVELNIEIFFPTAGKLAVFTLERANLRYSHFSTQTRDLNTPPGKLAIFTLERANWRYQTRAGKLGDIHIAIFTLQYSHCGIHTTEGKLAIFTLASPWQVHLGSLAEKVGGLGVVCDWADMLSSGEQQRVAFARLLLHEPQVWHLLFYFWVLFFWGI
jgi:hypothetical protein